MLSHYILLSRSAIIWTLFNSLKVSLICCLTLSDKITVKLCDALSHMIFECKLYIQKVTTVVSIEFSQTQPMANKKGKIKHSENFNLHILFYFSLFLNHILNIG